MFWLSIKYISTISISWEFLFFWSTWKYIEFQLKSNSYNFRKELTTTPGLSNPNRPTRMRCTLSWHVHIYTVYTYLYVHRLRISMCTLMGFFHELSMCILLQFFYQLSMSFYFILFTYPNKPVSIQILSKTSFLSFTRASTEKKKLNHLQINKN